MSPASLSFCHEYRAHPSSATAFESFQLGAGHPTEVAVWTRSFPKPTRKTGRVVLNLNKRNVWKEHGPTKGQCLWEMHGVWGWDKNKNEAIVLRESYFGKHPMSGKKVRFSSDLYLLINLDCMQIDWYTDFYYPFLNKWAERVRSASSPEKIVFVETIPNEVCHCIMKCSTAQLNRFSFLVLPVILYQGPSTAEHSLCTPLVCLDRLLRAAFKLCDMN